MMNVIKIEPTVALNILKIENVINGMNIDDGIYIGSNEMIKLELTKQTFKFNYNDLSDDWKVVYHSAYEEWLTGGGSGVPGDPNGFEIDTFVVHFAGTWKMYYTSIDNLITLIQTL